MDIRKIILKNSTNGGDYIPDYHYDALEKDINGLIRQALELACERAELIQDDRVIVDEDGEEWLETFKIVNRESIMSIMDEL